MKTYIKPSVNVVDLAVKENIAGLPLAAKGNVDTNADLGNSVTGTLTTYNLAAQNLGSTQQG